ncbi:Hypothetical protein CINCED_3A023028 [Cinara cedri]|uniref:Uncharacterized protein n=1 Tax=Cinara cedri TaxID=506608 RepID=A0A5E4MV09_9HEMI|nr:Hypothetical protein CINCED_3A023028 [Cinara cedri]
MQITFWKKHILEAVERKSSADRTCAEKPCGVDAELCDREKTFGKAGRAVDRRSKTLGFFSNAEAIVGGLVVRLRTDLEGRTNPNNNDNNNNINDDLCAVFRHPHCDTNRGDIYKEKRIIR